MKNPYHKLINIASAVLFSALTTLAVADTLKFHHPYPPMLYSAKYFIEPLVAELNEDLSTTGLNIKIYSSMALGGKPNQLPDQLESGFIDFYYTAYSYTPGRYPIMGIFDLPFMTNLDPITTSRAIWRFVEMVPEIKNEFVNQRPIAMLVPGNGRFHTSEPYTTLDSLKGVKIRTPSRPMATLMKEVGIEPVGLPLPEVPLAISTGIIDGMATPWEVVSSFKLQDTTTNTTIVETKTGRGLYSVIVPIMMNQNTYDSLTDEQQRIIDKHSGLASSGRGGKVMYESDELSKTRLNPNHNTFVLSEEDTDILITAAMEIHNSYIEELNAMGYDGQALYDLANKLLDEEAAKGK